jgi:hypothetical protein
MEQYILSINQAGGIVLVRRQTKDSASVPSGRVSQNGQGKGQE